MKRLLKKIYHNNRLAHILINKIYNFYLTSSFTNLILYRGIKRKRLDKEMDFFISKILRKENFAFVRNADGERAIMQGKSVESQEKKWTSPDYISKLGIDILDSLNVVDKRFYYAISCPCCDREAYYWYASRICNNGVDANNLTFSNLWINRNFRRFKKEFEKIKRDCVLIANYRASGAKIGNLNVLRHYAIDDDCISFWDNKAQSMLDSIKKDFGNSKDLLFVVSCGPMSSPIIKNLFLHNPNNTYIDFGSSIDSYYIHTQTRPYQDRYSLFGSRNCYMYKDLDISVSVVLTLYKRGDLLKEQLESILEQSLKPREVILFVESLDKKDDVANKLEQRIPKDLESKFHQIITPKYNVGVWGRFSAGLLAKSKYICFFDDDTIPAHRWLENCFNESLKKDALYGGIGILSNNLSKYPFSMAHRTIGWNNNPPFAINNKKTMEVDFVGHSWFLKKDYLGAMWINSNEFYKMHNVAEDAYLSFALKKYLGIKTFVPPHKDKEFFSSTIGLEYGKDTEGISSNEANLLKMNKALKLLKKQGMREVSFNLKWYILSLGNNILKKFLDKDKLQNLKNKLK